MPLLDDRGAVYAEYADISVPHLVVIDKRNGAIREIRFHAVALNPDSICRALRIIRLELVRLAGLSGLPQRRSGGGGIQKEIDNLRLFFRLSVLQKVPVFPHPLQLIVRHTAHLPPAPPVQLLIILCQPQRLGR